MLKHKFFISPDLFLYEGIFELPLKIAGEEGNYISAVNDGKFQCTLCDFTCARKDNIRRHIRLKHGRVEDQAWQCQFCDGLYKSKLSLESHQRLKHNIYKNVSQ